MLINLVRKAITDKPKRELSLDKLGIDIVHGCQLRCVGCPNSTIKPKIKEMARDDFAVVLNNIDVQEVNLFRLFNFGEPLLHSDLPGILEQIPKQSWKAKIIELSTNAQYHDFNMLAQVMRTRVLNRLVVSCDGDGTPDVYERLRPPGKWQSMIKFLTKAKELRDAHAPSLQLMTRTICDDKAAQSRWRDILEPLGWKPEFRAWQYLPQSSQNMLDRDLKVPQRVCSFISPGNRLYVDYDGTVVPCCVHPRASVFGSLIEQKYSEILKGKVRLDVMKQMDISRAGMGVCNSCEY